MIMNGMLVTVKNIGKSPASHVNIYARYITENNAATQGLFASQHKICDPLRQDVPLPEGAEHLDMTMLPGDAFPVNVTVSTEGNGANPKTLVDNVFIAVGCIDYQIFGQAAHHQTSFVYDLQRRDGKATVFQPGLKILDGSFGYAHDLGGTGPVD